MITERLEKLADFKLGKSSHKSIEDGACVMEMVAYIAGEPWSDHPQCACPILTECAIRLNDKFNDDHRQLLKPFIEKLIGTRATDEIQIARKRLIRWRYVTVSYPMILDLFKLPEMATTLRAFGNNLEDMAKAAAFLKKNREAIYKAAYAYAHAYASALRQQLADTAIETLRLAIEVKAS